MRAPDAEAFAGQARLRSVAIGVLGLALIALAWRAAAVLAAALAGIPFPLSLDYGEGIVIEQALMIIGPRAYGPITDLPFIVFHYPPVYHLVVRGIAGLAGFAAADLVGVGRAISVLSSIVAAVAVGALAHSLTPATLSNSKRIAAGTAAGLLALGTAPFAFWMPFARVDMLSLAFTLSGLALAVRAGGSRVRLHGAVLLFILAVYTKQTAIAAPMAVVLALLMTDRRRAWEMIASGLIASLLLLGLAQWLTDGGFLRHVVGYNVNRFDPARLGLLVAPLLMQLPMLLVVTIGLRTPVVEPARPVGEPAAPPCPLTVMMLHFGLCTAMLVTIAKSGSSGNYMLEWCCSAAVLAGMAFGRAMATLAAPPARAFLGGVPAAIMLGMALALQAVLPPDPRHPLVAAPPHLREAAATLLRLVREADQPPISDDMVLVLRADKRVLWEPAIFAELASLGRWDEAAITNAIHAGRFSMAITVGSRGDYMFDSRYNPAVADAMDAAWPQKARLGWFILHLPADAPLPAGAVPVHGRPRG